MKGLDAGGLPEDLVFENSGDEEPASLLAIGSLVGGKYKIKRVLGSGGNGAVYEGEHTAIGHRVAIKVARLSQKERAHTLARFSREARICGSLRHPNVGQVYDVGMLDDGSPYMVMELQEGRSLGDIFDEMQLPIAALADITRQLLAGLAAAHAAGVIHRDIKPDNVMIVRDVKGAVVVKLVDFGISKTMHADRESGTIDEDVIVGSPDYMAPEQFRGTTIDVRTDLYAVGVLLYEGITGRLPFKGETIADLLISVFQDAVEPPTALRSDCPSELGRIVQSAMSRDPALRPQSADLMARELDRLGGEQQAVDLTGLDEQPHGKSTAVHRRRTADLRTLQNLGAQVEGRSHGSRARRPLWLVAGSVAVIALIALIAALSHLRSAPATPANAHPPTLVRAPSAPTAPEAKAAAPETQRTASPATTEVSAPDAEQAATLATRSRERSARATPAHGARRVAPSVATKATPPVAPAATPVLASAKTSTAEATATTALFREAGIAFVRGEAARARDLYLQVLARDPARADAYRGLGLASARVGRRAEAVRAFERYLQLRAAAPDSARIRAELAKLR